MSDQLYSLLSRCITETCLSSWNKTAVIDKNAEAGVEKFDFLWNIKEQVLGELGCPLSLLAMFMDEIRQSRVFQDLFNFSIPHRLISRRDVCLPDFPNSIDWQLFMKLYPDSGGLISCAWPVIDDEKKQALLHTGIESGPRIGAGGLSYYREENGIYIRKATYATWAQA
jgi:hypothetical protein